MGTRGGPPPGGASAELISLRGWLRSGAVFLALLFGATGLGLLLGSTTHQVTWIWVVGILGVELALVLALLFFAASRRLLVGPDWIASLRGFRWHTLPAAEVRSVDLRTVVGPYGSQRRLLVVQGPGKERITIQPQLLKDPARRAALERFVAAAKGASAQLPTQPAITVVHQRHRRARRILGWAAAVAVGLNGLVAILRVTNVLRPIGGSSSSAVASSTSAQGTGSSGALVPGLPARLTLADGWQAVAPSRVPLSQVQLQPGGLLVWRRAGYQDSELVVLRPPGSSGSTSPLVVLALSRFSEATGAGRAFAYQRQADRQVGEQELAVPGVASSEAYLAISTPPGPSLVETWAQHGALLLKLLTVTTSGAAPAASIQQTDETQALKLSLAALPAAQPA